MLFCYGKLQATLTRGYAFQLITLLSFYSLRSDSTTTQHLRVIMQVSLFLHSFKIHMPVSSFVRQKFPLQLARLHEPITSTRSTTTHSSITNRKRKFCQAASCLLHGNKLDRILSGAGGGKRKRVQIAKHPSTD